MTHDNVELAANGLPRCKKCGAEGTIVEMGGTCCRLVDWIMQQARRAPPPGTRTKPYRIGYRKFYP